MVKRTKPAISVEGLVSLVQVSDAGLLRRRDLQSYWRDVNEALRRAKSQQRLAIFDDYIYDPARIQKEAVIQLAHAGDGHGALPNFAAMLYEILEASSEPALLAQDISAQFGAYFTMDLISDAELKAQGIEHLQLALYPPYTQWYYLKDQDYEAVYEYALSKAQVRQDAAWIRVLEWAGDELRDGASEDDTARSRALARLYSRSQAESLLSLSDRTFRVAMRRNLLPRIECPDGGKRMRAVDVHRLRDDADLRQSLEDEMEVNLWQIRAVTDLKISHLRTLFHNEGVRPSSRAQEGRENSRTGRGKNPQRDLWYLWGGVRRVLWPEGDHPTLRKVDEIDQNEGIGRRDIWSERIIEIHRELAERKRQQEEAREKRRREREDQRERLRAQMIDNFPSWLTDTDVDQTVYVHVGPTNSGKTHDALLELAAANSGWYLAPLRLLAREMFERLNQSGVYCNLLTGEEEIRVPGARVTAATVEMFNPEKSGECVVVDEAHMIADNQRGWAWTRALVNTHAPQVHVITAPHGLKLLTRIFENRGIETQVLFHARLVPLEVADRPWTLEELPSRTILVAFSRRDVLKLKHFLQERGRQVSVVYGALPPEVRLKQAQRFALGETEICVATDAVGMGLNLPADNVVFSALTKFDGYDIRYLYAHELQQIAGRAGRFGLSEKGLVTGIDEDIWRRIKRAINLQVEDLQAARISPRTDEIELLEGDLVRRLSTWEQLNAIPESLRDILTSTDLDPVLELAAFLSLEDLTNLGVEQALTLVSAPARRESQEYWVECATAILRNEQMPLPPPPPLKIDEGRALKEAETVIACMDIYLWLGNRHYFRHLSIDPQIILSQREALTAEIDYALMRRLDAGSRRRRPRDMASWYDDL